ncbi:hypothetical protein [Chryseolinea lacunae]|uniref:Lipoprotein n=1 Tax=Chryseolinea lacunae TaxID=2801331 RepID=A0ABS1KR31_9BACT|nr:hypothetical protein [Chryseolinea lacunae]MBL0741901.1 hypothetical protein [Chryseolinea lacunae]
MKKMVCIGLLALAACGGKLTDEQRQKLHEGMDQHKIVKLSDSEIMTAALDQGRAVFAGLEQIRFSPEKVDSIAKHHHAKVRWIVPGSGNALEVESQLIEAYVIGAETGSTQDNIQKLYHAGKQEDYDSVLYSRPIVSPLPDGAVNVDGVWNIYLSKKNVILALGKKH